MSPWLLGELVQEAKADAPSCEQRRAARALLPRAFPQGGYHLLGSRFGTDDEVLMTVDTGELGYLSLAAHGHADALSVRLSVAGQPILVDRGTCTYNADPAWRHYFRGTLAHNTVTMDGADQSSYGGPFLWLRHAKTQLDEFSSDDRSGVVDAWHDGYQHGNNPVVHRRRVEWQGGARRFVVIDELRGNGTHEVAIAWHFDPACQIELIATRRVFRHRAWRCFCACRPSPGPAPGNFTSATRRARWVGTRHRSACACRPLRWSGARASPAPRR